MSTHQLRGSQLKNHQGSECYAPTKHPEEEVKDFYNSLQSVLDKEEEKDLKILMGDFNAKAGTNNSRYEHGMGQHGLGRVNESKPPGPEHVYLWE